MKFASVLVALFAVICSLPSIAAVPDTLTYAGSLRRGDVPADGTFSVVVSLFRSADGGTALFTQSDPSLPVSAGELIVDLGDNPANPLNDDVLGTGELFMAIVVDGEELSPRVPITSVPFARRARSAEGADNVGGLTADDIASLYQAGGGLVRTGTTFSLADNAVASGQIIDGTVSSADLADESITAVDLAPNACGNSEIADNSVTSAKIAFGSIGSEELRVSSVSAVAIEAGAVKSEELANSTVRARHLGGGGIPVFQEAAGCPGVSGLTMSSVCLFSCLNLSSTPAGCACVNGVNGSCANDRVGQLVAD